MNSGSTMISITLTLTNSDKVKHFKNSIGCIHLKDKIYGPLTQKGQKSRLKPYTCPQKIRKSKKVIFSSLFDALEICIFSRLKFWMDQNILFFCITLYLGHYNKYFIWELFVNAQPWLFSNKPHTQYLFIYLVMLTLTLIKRMTRTKTKTFYYYLTW